MVIKEISPSEFAQLRQANPVILIDVRTPAEYETMHVDGARSIPLDRLDPQQLQTDPTCAKNSSIYVICQKGGRGKQACERLIAFGYENVTNVEGGTLACEQVGLPMIRGRKTMSLERQVRIAAGSLVAIGTALGAFVDIVFLGIPAFVGCGLVFAGISDICPMANLLGKMPWNQRGAGSCSVQ
jgi:rhodanese-related sulfurtransferase